MSKTIFYLFACFTLIVSGCAYAPQSIKLEDSFSTSISDIGDGRSVYVEVHDTRDEKVVGSRSDSYGIGAVISMSENFIDMISIKIQKGLEQKGFISSKNKSSQKLTILLNELSYISQLKFTKFIIHVSTSAKAEVGIGADMYSNTYSIRQKTEKFIVPTSEDNIQYITDAVDALVEKIVSDKNLIKVLAK